ncbi:MAG: hypothetical protein KA087_03360 [Candidatus Saccharicenans sp.]|jgi:hypothetical protein|nr:hypothetical protein [Candidatus Saccharicenans sp.]
MSISLADLYRQNSDLETFCQEVRKLGGNFELDARQMEALGQAYFEVHPEKFVQRNLDEVRLGYQLARCCLLEKALAGLPPAVKDFFRQAFDQPECIAGLLDDYRRSENLPLLVSSFNCLQASLDELKAAIDELPKGMIKERFLGGISTLYNTRYLLSIFISRLGSNGLQN